jgi:hypothetical protein
MAGRTITQPTNPPGTYTLPPCYGTFPGLNFGNFQLVSVSGNVYNDVNGKGQQNTGEPGLKGWTVNVVDSSNKVVAFAVTDSKGNYTITGVGQAASRSKRSSCPAGSLPSRPIPATTRSRPPAASTSATASLATTTRPPTLAPSTTTRTATH